MHGTGFFSVRGAVRARRAAVAPLSLLRVWSVLFRKAPDILVPVKPVRVLHANYAALSGTKFKFSAIVRATRVAAQFLRPYGALNKNLV